MVRMGAMHVCRPAAEQRNTAASRRRLEEMSADSASSASEDEETDGEEACLEKAEPLQSASAGASVPKQGKGRPTKAKARSSQPRQNFVRMDRKVHFYACTRC